MHELSARADGSHTKLVARFSFECLVYIEFHPCDCGSNGPMDVRIARQGECDVAIYENSCGVCRRSRRFEFVIGSEYEAQSQIVDAGQWLLVAERIARRLPADLQSMSEEERGWAGRELERAVVALEEALKFVPDDDDRVPFAALFSEGGKALHGDDPGRFRKPRIEAIVAVYRDSLERLPRTQ